MAAGWPHFALSTQQPQREQPQTLVAHSFGHCVTGSTHLQPILCNTFICSCYIPYLHCSWTPSRATSFQADTLQRSAWWSLRTCHVPNSKSLMNNSWKPWNITLIRLTIMGASCHTNQDFSAKIEFFYPKSMFLNGFFIFCYYLVDLECCVQRKRTVATRRIWWSMLCTSMAS